MDKSYSQTRPLIIGKEKTEDSGYGQEDDVERCIYRHDDDDDDDPVHVCSTTCVSMCQRSF